MKKTEQPAKATKSTKVKTPTAPKVTPKAKRVTKKKVITEPVVPEPEVVTAAPAEVKPEFTPTNKSLRRRNYWRNLSPEVRKAKRQAKRQRYFANSDNRRKNRVKRPEKLARYRPFAVV